MSADFPSPATVELTHRVASVGLGGTTTFPREPLGPWPWRELVTAVQVHRITGLLAAAVHREEFAVTPEQLAEVRRLHAEMMGICVRLESDMLVVTEILRDVGVDSLVLKGPSFAHLDYPDPSLRFFGDIDLLVRSDAWDLAADVLSAHGYVRRFPQVRRSFDRRFGKGASFMGPSGREIDLHRTFVSGPFGLTVELDDLWSRTEPFTVGDSGLRALDVDHRFLHACYHAAIGKRVPQLVPLRDLAGMLGRRDRPVDVDRVRSVAARWRGEAVLARAVTSAWDLFDLPGTELSRWAATYHPTADEQRSLRTYLDPRMGYAARSFVALRAVPGARARFAFAWALLFPDRAYGVGRHAGRGRRWLEALRQIAQLERGERNR